MKTLVVGPRIPDFDNGYNAAIEQAFRSFGHDTRLIEFDVSTPKGLLNRLKIDIPLRFGFRTPLERHIRQFNQELDELQRAFQPDLVFVLRGSRVHAETLASLPLGVSKILWCYDKVERSEVSERQLLAYDHIFVFEPSDVEVLSSRVASVVSFLPMGYEPTTYRPLGCMKDVDVFFVGAYYPERRELLEYLARNLRGSNLKFYGRHLRYTEPKTWLRAIWYAIRFPGVFKNRSLCPVEINKFYARSKICLNIHHQQSQGGCNPRVLELAGAGAFQLVDKNEFVSTHFADCSVQYNMKADLLEKVH